MKKRLGQASLLLSFVLLSFRTLFSIDAVTTALRLGNVDQLAPYLDYRVDISLPDKTDTYSKSQAELVIRDFFATNEVKNFQVKASGTSEGIEYCVGVLQTKKGNYRTTLHLRQQGDRLLLKELDFADMP